MKKSKLATKTIALFLTVLMLLSVAPLAEFAGLDLGINLKADAVSGYSAGGAAQWAKDHWQDHDSVLLGTGYWDDGGDCANFVSQCLYMGGIDMDGFWNTNGYKAHWTEPYGWDYAGSFIRCVQLYNYLVYQKGAQVIQNPSASQVEIGDVLIYYRAEVNRYGHSAIVADIEGGVPKIAYHSTGWNCGLTTNWHLNFNGNQTYLLKMHGSVCVNQRTRSFDVYTARSGDLGLYWNSNANSGVRRTFLSGEYAHVYSVKTENGYTWGYTFRYGDWGWIKLNSFQYRGHYSTPSVSHLFGAWETIQIANCQQDGLDRRVCTRCGYTETRTTKGGHITDPHATCTTEGLCKVCGIVTENALGHIWDEGRTSKQPTCTEPGDMLYYCNRDSSHRKTEEGTVPALGHDYQATAAAPTCVQDGLTTYTCSRCGNSYVTYTDPDNTWSGWTDQTPAQVGLSGDKVRQTKQYRSRTKSKTTSPDPELEGWIYDYTSTNYSDYGPWSEWSTTPVESSNTRDVESQAGYYLVSYCYQYNASPYQRRYRDASINGNYSGFGYRSSYGEYSFSRYAFASEVNSATAVSSGANSPTSPSECPGRNDVGATGYWMSEATGSNIYRIFYIKSNVTFYRYRDRTIESYTYHFYRWSEWSPWQEEEIKLSLIERILGNKEVETRTAYSYDLAALGHDFSVQQEQAFVDRDLLLTDEQVNNTCYNYGYVCSRCGAASPDSISTPHNIPDFETERDQYEIVSGDDASVTVYKGLCRNGCGCYVLKTVDNHNYVVKEVVPPTCNGEHGTEGYTVYRCTYHGEEYNADFVPGIPDDYSHDIWEVRTSPTCTQKGEMICKCARYDACGHYIKRDIEPLGHTMTKFDAVAMTCTQDGNSEYYYCSACNMYFADAEGKTVIEENSWIIPHTGHVDKAEVEWTVEVERKCGSAGWERKYCTNEWCDGKFECSKHQEIHGAVLAERETDAIKADYYVFDAVDAIYDPTIEADNEFDKWVSTTCDHTGTIYITCRNCEGTPDAHGWVLGEPYSTMDAKPIPHTPVEVREEPICIYDGIKHVNCSFCGKEDIEDPEIIPAEYSEHDLVEKHAEDGGCIYYECSRCDYVEPGSHDFQRDTNRDVAPTCTETGSEAYTCSRCGMTDDKALSELGHDMAVTDSKPATCTERGVDIYTCQRKGCDYSYEVETSQCLGHDYSGSYSVKEKATCTEDGKKTLNCVRENARTGEICNAELSWLKIPARGEMNAETGELGHIWSDWEVVRPLTSDGPGLERRVCLNQDETEEYEACAAYESRPINGHQAIFMAKDKNGEYIEVGRVCFTEGTTAISAPTFENYDDRFVAYWPDFSEELAKNEDFVVKAVYQSKGTIVPSDLETDKTVKYVKSDATVTLSAFAETLNVRPKLGAEPVDIVLVLDHSKSMVDNTMSDKKTTRYKALQDAAKAFVENVYENAEYNGVNHRIAVVAYNKEAYAFNGIDWESTSSLKPSFISVLNQKQTVLNILNAPRQNSSGTCTDAGISAAKDLLTMDGSRKQLVVLFTDGEPTSYSIDRASGFSISVANRAISIAKDIKQSYHTPVYCIGVTKDAKPGDPVNTNPSSTKDKLNTFLHAVSSNYPNATELLEIGSRISSSEENSYYVSATSTDELTGLFNNIVSEQVTNNITFQNITIVDTVSKYFTLTQQQEAALRQSLLITYGVTNDRITVTRNNDGTTTICIENISPKRVEKDGKNGYGITVSYVVTANENAINEGTYSAVDSSGEDGKVACIMKDGEVYAEYTLEEIGSFTVSEPRYIVRYVIDGETIDIIDIDSSMLNQEVDTPDYALLKLAEENNFVVSDQDTVIHYTYLNEQHSVTWIVADETETDTYYTGEIIRIPKVNAVEGYLFAGWDGEVPFRMGSADLTFTAKFVAHSHDYYKTVSGSCDTGATYTYTCPCGNSYSVAAEPTAHTYVANVSYCEGVAYASVTCSECGKVYQEETAIMYQAAASGRADAEFYDLTLEEGSTPVQPDGTIIVKVALDDDALLTASKLYAYRIENGGKTEVRIEKNGSFALLYLDHFSYYMLSTKPESSANIPAFQDLVCKFNGHTLSHVDAKAATTEAEGNVEYYHCTVCGKNFSDAAGTSELTKVTIDKLSKPDEPTTEKQDEPTTQKQDDSGSSSKGNCPYCGGTHTGFFGWLIKLIHLILALFGLHK